MSIVSAVIRAGVWQGVFDSGPRGAPPDVEVLHQERRLDGVEVEATAEAGIWKISVPIPAELLSDGVQTFLVCDAVTGDRLDAFTIIAGVPPEDDLRAEIGLLRAELDLLKTAFRRHCAQTAKG
ncbi:hypothetical protein [Albidovulum sp.]